ncbi:MAG: helix-hairpin-helix domain-containing protein [Bacteroidota bacterium]|nr:helix-hairpin-helix domain-containing protein [Bacteroidota bacterium]
MPTDNYYIADQFSMLAKLMDIHGENSFKTRSYSSAAFTIEKLPAQLADMPPQDISSIRGIGDAIGKKIQDILATGELRILQEYVNKTPPGVIGMLNIKGLGPKKIATIWKEMEIESIGELLYACQENRLMLYKGFGEKTQENVRGAIEFHLQNQGSHLYAEIEAYAGSVQTKLQTAFPEHGLALTGEFRRQLEVIENLQWVTTIAPDALRQLLTTEGFAEEANGSLSFKGPEGIRLLFHCTDANAFGETLLKTSCSPEFMEAWTQRTGGKPAGVTEESLFTAAGLPFIAPCLREDPAILDEAMAGPFPTLIQPGDIRAIIHSHSNWSDGSNSLEEMARACMTKGYEYLVISDHSKSAFYANGLNEDRIREQHALIDELNRKLAPFTIFKSIECDILNDGSLDYSDAILSTFDLVIASVHSNLKMSQEKAMMRLVKAITNPYTCILGHMTGRLLLSRPGYPVDHEMIIDACAEHRVAIELNAHPRRLDMDWRWIRHALKKGVMISVDPDAHSTEGFEHTKYGILAAQKGGLTADRNLSSYGLERFKAYLAERKKARGI